LRTTAVLLTIVAALGAAAFGWRALRARPTAVDRDNPPVFVQTVENRGPAPGPAPAGMVWIPGGEFSMGAQDPPHMNDSVGMQATRDARPIHRVYVDGFWMDTTEVTNAQFAAFVKATGYVTIAERTPLARDYPGAPPENLVAGSVVFSPPDHPVPLNDHFQWWSYVKGANWRHPLGPGSSIVGKEHFPVVHVGYPDALAYAKWAGKRIPTESFMCGGSCAPLENSPPGIHTIPSGAGPGAGLRFSTVCMKAGGLSRSTAVGFARSARQPNAAAPRAATIVTTTALVLKCGRRSPSLVDRHCQSDRREQEPGDASIAPRGIRESLRHDGSAPRHTHQTARLRPVCTHPSCRFGRRPASNR